MPNQNQASAPTVFLSYAPPDEGGVAGLYRRLQDSGFHPWMAGLDILPGETVEFQPGELHLMLLKPKTRPGEGEKIPLTLTFEKAGRVEVELVVARSPPEDANEHQDHMQ